MDNHAQYYCAPVDKTNHKEWILRSELKYGQGVQGSVYNACQDENCDYAMKIVPFKDDHTRNLYKLEVKNHTLAAKHDLVPRIDDHWICGDDPKVGFIVMRVLDITVNRFIKHAMDDDNKIPNDELYLFLEDIRRIGFHMLDQLHELGVYHGDLHLGNIMLERHDNEECSYDRCLYIPSINTWYKVYMIDMGMSGSTSKPRFRRIVHRGTTLRNDNDTPEEISKRYDRKIFEQAITQAERSIQFGEYIDA
jgi:serine/threonine protein kinase